MEDAGPVGRGRFRAVPARRLGGDIAGRDPSASGRRQKGRQEVSRDAGGGSGRGNCLLEYTKGAADRSATPRPIDHTIGQALTTRSRDPTGSAKAKRSPLGRGYPINSSVSAEIG